MPGRVFRTQTAVRVADFLATREGKAHLSNYGWAPGMPIVMTHSVESLNDAMGMVSIHGCAVLVAMLAPQTGELHLLHVTTPQPALKVVKLCEDTRTMGEFFDHFTTESIAEFRVKFWKYSAVAHKIPTCASMHSQNAVATRYSLTSHRPAALLLK